MEENSRGGRGDEGTEPAEENDRITVQSREQNLVLAAGVRKTLEKHGTLTFEMRKQTQGDVS